MVCEVMLLLPPNLPYLMDINNTQPTMSNYEKITELLNEIEELLADINYDLRCLIIPNFKYNHGDDQYVGQYVNTLKHLSSEDQQ